MGFPATQHLFMHCMFGWCRLAAASGLVGPSRTLPALAAGSNLAQLGLQAFGVLLELPCLRLHPKEQCLAQRQRQRQQLAGNARACATADTDTAATGSAAATQRSTQQRAAGRRSTHLQAPQLVLRRGQLRLAGGVGAALPLQLLLQLVASLQGSHSAATV